VEYPRIPDILRAEAGIRKLPAEAAISIRSVTAHASRRIVEAAFQYAVKHGRRKVTAVHKANVLRATCGVFLEAAQEVAARYPKIEFETANVDAMGMWLLKNPRNYDVIVTTNLFGDILSDLCAQLVGGMGFGYSGNIGDNYAVFEPTHGSAPKYAGLDKVNPIATILAAKMMAEWLGETTVARIIEPSVAEVIEHGTPRTYDMGGAAGTHEIARAVAKRAAALAEHPATEEQINMRAALAQRIDKQGTKIEELAGTGVPDTQGG
jgi:3-isopropylmalate dehydrogenase